jgi:hypothetical protein
MPLRDLEYDEWELIRSALRYYANGTAYPAKNGVERQRRRAVRARILADSLDESIPTTIDEDGTGNTVKWSI